jgi:flavin reductase (DIM6/NTAB) family NADH-FMN oxidoreductase RutF
MVYLTPFSFNHLFVMPTFDFSQELPANLYKLLIGSVVPRPIAWVSTVSEEGDVNLAPFSYFTIASINPPILAFAPQNARTPEGTGRTKDTLANIRATGECVIHIVPYALSDPMNLSAAMFPPDVNEFEEAGLAHADSVKVKPPRVADAPIAFECVLDRIVSWGEHAQAGHLVCVKVVFAHFKEGLVENYKISLEALDPISRLGGNAYGRTKDSTFDLPRPDDVKSIKAH